MAIRGRVVIAGASESIDRAASAVSGGDAERWSAGLSARARSNAGLTTSTAVLQIVD
jgi:hypothetical protein